MDNKTQFENHGFISCDQCEAYLTDALDGTLTPEEQTEFDFHIATCVTCSQMLADAQRGAAWLEMLRTPRPEPSAALLERIIAQTSGAEHGSQNLELGRTIPFVPAEMTPLSTPHTRGVILPFRSRIAALGQTYLQPRLMMTAAMAFFSIALTLNLTGIHLNELHASDLTPSGVSRGISNARGHVLRYYDNLPVVYELESRVDQLKRSNENNDRNDPYRPGQDVFNGSQSDSPDPINIKPNASATEQEQPEQKPQPTGPGSSRSETPDSQHKVQFLNVSLLRSRELQLRNTAQPANEGGQV
jgi:hypothetical protein